MKQTPREAVVVRNEYTYRQHRLCTQVVETLDNHSRYEMILPSGDYGEGDKLWITTVGNRWANIHRSE